MADKKCMTTQQELRAALEELARTGREAIDAGREFSLTMIVGHEGSTEWAIPSSEILAMSAALRQAEALLKKENR